MTDGLFVSVPVKSFRAPRAREYLETLPVPPPSTVYGMLCALVGEVDGSRHVGAELAIGVLTPGARSRVLRLMWQTKRLDEPRGVGPNKGPDYQELLTGLRIAVHVRQGDDQASPDLAQRVGAALERPADVVRFGRLSLGESTSLVDEIRSLRGHDLQPDSFWLVKSPDGLHTLPLWADHISGAQTRWGQFAEGSMLSPATPPDQAWARVEPIRDRK